VVERAYKSADRRLRKKKDETKQKELTWATAQS